MKRRRVGDEQRIEERDGGVQWSALPDVCSFLVCPDLAAASLTCRAWRLAACGLVTHLTLPLNHPLLLAGPAKSWAEGVARLAQHSSLQRPEDGYAAAATPVRNAGAGGGGGGGATGVGPSGTAGGGDGATGAAAAAAVADAQRTPVSSPMWVSPPAMAPLPRLRTDFPAVRHITLIHNALLHRAQVYAALSTLRALWPGVRGLSVHDSVTWDLPLDYSALGVMTHLTSLELLFQGQGGMDEAGQPLYRASMPHICRLSQLRELCMKWIIGYDVDSFLDFDEVYDLLASLVQHGKLRSLQFGGENINAQGARHLASMTSLERLQQALAGASSGGDEGDNVDIVELMRSFNAAAQAQGLSAAEALHATADGGGGGTAPAARRVPALPTSAWQNLRSLSLAHWPCVYGKLRDVGPPARGRCYLLRWDDLPSSLEALLLVRCQLEGSRPPPRLRHLWLADCITGEDALPQVLSAARGLETLVLRWPSRPDEQPERESQVAARARLLRAIQSLQGLRTLGLGGIRCADVSALSPLSLLRNLMLEPLQPVRPPDEAAAAAQRDLGLLDALMGLPGGALAGLRTLWLPNWTMPIKQLLQWQQMLQAAMPLVVLRVTEYDVVWTVPTPIMHVVQVEPPTSLAGRGRQRGPRGREGGVDRSSSADGAGCGAGGESQAGRWSDGQELEWWNIGCWSVM
ncbi:hypothetical protein GPECTOR_51g747 [Gonium pectorale]|uniref:F-box domain-containing protein n=1 Tax=Gonium pectorale TaxID=33097 RepID=A0A150G7G1_GONPE|nr:hypothetical protein GPECTOR_51g747 [Gonium pectorale]|eukprot:KXZ45761.1 hypothetical protein GPECTOR_51g747 [Gonium pectorale]